MKKIKSYLKNLCSRPSLITIMSSWWFQRWGQSQNTEKMSAHPYSIITRNLEWKEAIDGYKDRRQKLLLRSGAKPTSNDDSIWCFTKGWKTILRMGGKSINQNEIHTVNTFSWIFVTFLYLLRFFLHLIVYLFLFLIINCYYHFDI